MKKGGERKKEKRVGGKRTRTGAKDSMERRSSIIRKTREKGGRGNHPGWIIEKKNGNVGAERRTTL